ncbi:MAG: SpoIIIAC/SpoIIIAD family protein [Clostridia bacterium]|nr:SpoIIIAC/SpoIIIAD family protein [Clostridia bacterium]
MNVLSICGIAIIAAISAIALKKNAPETSVVIAISAGVIIFLFVLSDITPVINEVYKLVNNAGIDTDYGKVLLKTVGICLACQFTSDSCKDAGQSSLAARVELAGKISVLIISIPLFEKILNVATGLLT